VYARHGHEFMGWKSPVGGHDDIRITTSRGQGQVREELSEGSPNAKVRADEQKLHRRLSPWASQHKMTKPMLSEGQGKCSGCAPKAHVLIRGDLSGAAAPLSCTVNNQTGLLVEQGPGVWRCCRPTRANEAANGARRRGALRSNAWRDWTEVSRGRTSRHPPRKKGTAKGRTRMDKEER